MPIQRVLIIANNTKRGADTLAQNISSYLRTVIDAVEVYGYTGIPKRRTFGRYDLAISIGGDGTALYVCRVLAAGGTPILPLNFGDFGFITEISQDEWRREIDIVLRGEMAIQQRVMADVMVRRAGRVHHRFLGLNEAVVSTGGISKLERFEVYLGAEKLGDFGADGLIVATATGSTAYSAAAGGPILHPELRALIVNPICPFTLSNRPLVIPEGPVGIRLVAELSTSVMLTVDGQQHIKLQPSDEVVVDISAHTARIVRTQRRTFYEVLSSKLGWSGYANA